MHAFLYHAYTEPVDATYSFQTIVDVRAFQKQLKLIPPKPLTFLLSDAHLWSTEISNALLKTIEEPNLKITFILTATNWQQMSPTVLSRCTAKKNQPYSDIGRENLTPDLDKWYHPKNKTETVLWLDRLISYYHQELLKGKHLKQLATNLSLTETTRKNILANGHLLLNMVNLVYTLKAI